MPNWNTQNEGSSLMLRANEQDGARATVLAAHFVKRNTKFGGSGSKFSVRRNERIQDDGKQIQNEAMSEEQLLFKANILVYNPLHYFQKNCLKYL